MPALNRFPAFSAESIILAALAVMSARSSSRSSCPTEGTEGTKGRVARRRGTTSSINKLPISGLMVLVSFRLVLKGDRVPPPWRDRIGSVTKGLGWGGYERFVPPGQACAAPRVSAERRLITTCFPGSKTEP